MAKFANALLLAAYFLLNGVFFYVKRSGVWEDTTVKEGADIVSVTDGPSVSTGEIIINEQNQPEEVVTDVDEKIPSTEINSASGSSKPVLNEETKLESKLSVSSISESEKTPEPSTLPRSLQTLAHGHADPHGDVHHGAALHAHEHSVLGGQRRHWAIIGLFFCIVLLSIWFEESQHALKHHLKETGQRKLLTMVDAMFKELTILGFVGLTLMTLVKTGALKEVAVLCFPNIAEKLTEGHHGEHHHESHRVLSTSGAPRRHLHGTGDPLTDELFVLFEEVHMMIFYVMVVFIVLVVVLLIQAQDTKKRFHRCEQMRMSEFLMGDKMRKKTFLQKVMGRHGQQDAVEYRLIRREFFHPWDPSLTLSDAKPATFDFAEYLGECMGDFVVDLVEIPSSGFAAVMVLVYFSHPVFDMSHFHRERFFMCIAWGIFFLNLAVWRHTRVIYYNLLPKYAEDINQIAEAERENAGKTHKPRYMSDPLKVGEHTWIAKIIGKNAFRKLYGTLAPSKHIACFQMWKNGPRLGCWLLQMGLFMQGIYIAVYCTHIVQYEESNLDMCLQFVPLFLALMLWPDILFTWTIITSTGQLKKTDIVHEVAKRVETEQFKKYSLLILELEVKALLHQIKSFDDYNKTGKAVKNGQYEKWVRDKLAQFDLTVPDEKKDAIAEMFHHHDADGSGMFDKNELQKLLASQGKDETHCKMTIRRWLDSGVFRPMHDHNTGELVSRYDPKDGNLMSSDDFKVFVLLNDELESGDFDEDRLGIWLEEVLDRSGDGIVSVDEFFDELGEACTACGIDHIGLRKMFKIIEASADESKEADEVPVTKMVVWLKKCAVQKRSGSKMKAKDSLLNAGGGKGNGHGH